MSKQIIVAIGREYGSGGLEIATLLAQSLGIGLYDKNLLSRLAEKYDLNPNELRKFEERPKNKLIARRIRGFSNSPEDQVANMEFGFLRDLASQGKSFVVVGRCGEEVLKDFPSMVSIFVRADQDFRQQRLVTTGRATDPEDAEKQIHHMDRSRRAYHDLYSQCKWGHTETYDLVINSARLRIPATADLLHCYVTSRINTR
ncbi:MAG: cytidylate kinase-like family protein [Ruminiclostridium sp.]|nr:cytidylate kinase-like family protein [Ruminiclostridium sp.]